MTEIEEIVRGGELKPCPFCGGEASIVGKRYEAKFCVGCDDDSCLGFSGLGWLYDSEHEAAEAWNRRVERTCGELRGEPRHDAIGYSAAHEDYELWCEHCDIELDDSWRFCPNCGAKVVTE